MHYTRRGNKCGPSQPVSHCRSIQAGRFPQGRSGPIAPPGNDIDDRLGTLPHVPRLGVGSEAPFSHGLDGDWRTGGVDMLDLLKAGTGVEASLSNGGSSWNLSAK